MLVYQRVDFWRPMVCRAPIPMAFQDLSDLLANPEAAGTTNGLWIWVQYESPFHVIQDYGYFMLLRMC